MENLVLHMVESIDSQFLAHDTHNLWNHQLDYSQNIIYQVGRPNCGEIQM